MDSLHPDLDVMVSNHLGDNEYVPNYLGLDATQKKIMRIG